MTAAVLVFAFLCVPRLMLPASHPVVKYEPQKAWRSYDVDVELRALYEGQECATRVVWIWNVDELDEPAEEMAIEECGRETVKVSHPYRRGRSFRAGVLFYRDRMVVGSDVKKGKP